MLLKTGLDRIFRLLTGNLRFKLIAWFFVPTAIILVAVALVNFNSFQNVTEDLVIERDRDLTQLWAGQLATNLSRSSSRRIASTLALRGSGSPLER